MTFPRCNDVCSGPRSHGAKRFPFAPIVRPVVYAEPAPAPVDSQHASYSIPAALTNGVYKGIPAGPMYTTNYVDAFPGASGSGRESTSRLPMQRVFVPAPVAGQYLSSPGPPEELKYVNDAELPGLETRGLVGQGPPSPLKVPEAGTQSRGNLKAETLYPRATTVPARMAPRSTFASERSEWEQEVKYLQSLLNSRDDQLEAKEAELQDALKELQELRKQSSGERQHAAAERSGDSAEQKSQDAELKTMRKRLDLLRHERQELIELLLQKEKQAAVLDTVDPTAKEASALHLGVQAISMVHSASELREKLKLAEAEIKKLRADRVAADELQQDTFGKLTDKRREAAELLELVSQRDMKVARVEAYLQQKSRELELLAARSKERLQKEQRMREQVKQEYLVATEQCNAYKASVSSRDQQIVQLQGEVVRRDTLMKHLEERVRVLSEDLTGAHAQLQQMIRGMAAKDAYMQELEAQLRKNDTERQVAYLSEVSKSRKLAYDTRIQQDECRAALNDKQEKLAAAKQELLRSQTAMERIRTAITAATAPEGPYVRSPALQSPAFHAHPAEVEIGPADLATDIPSVPVEQSLRSLNADYLIPQPAPSSPARCTSRQPPSAFTQAQSGANNPSSTLKTPTRIRTASPHGPGTSAPEHFCPPYSPVRDDVVDQAVARVFDKPEYRHLAAHICRLGPGLYLCCMKEVTMELDANGNVVVKSPSGEKILLTSYLNLLRPSLGATPTPSELGRPKPAAAKAVCQQLAREKQQNPEAP